MSQKPRSTVELLNSLDPSSAYVTESGDSVGKLKITETGSDAKFKELKFGFKYGFRYGVMELSPRNAFGENFHNMTVMELHEYLLSLGDYLAQNMGLSWTSLMPTINPWKLMSLLD